MINIIKYRKTIAQNYMKITMVSIKKLLVYTTKSSKILRIIQLKSGTDVILYDDCINDNKTGFQILNT